MLLLLNLVKNSTDKKQPTNSSTCN